MRAQEIDVCSAELADESLRDHELARVGTLAEDHLLVRPSVPSDRQDQLEAGCPIVARSPAQCVVAVVLELHDGNPQHGIGQSDMDRNVMAGRGAESMEVSS